MNVKSWVPIFAFMGDNFNHPKKLFVFSSPSHKVLKESYCDHPVSGVSRLSSVNNFFKHLLQNHWANLHETWQECSLGKALPKLFKEIDSTYNSGCHGNNKKNPEIFENLLL